VAFQVVGQCAYRVGGGRQFAQRIADVHGHWRIRLYLFQHFHGSAQAFLQIGSELDDLPSAVCESWCRSLSATFSERMDSLRSGEFTQTVGALGRGQQFLADFVQRQAFQLVQKFCQAGLQFF